MGEPHADGSVGDALLAAVGRGDQAAAEALLPLLYQELRALAASYLGDERLRHTLQPTALVHEAWLKVSRRTGPQWEGRGHFFAVAAKAMRQVLVDHARRRASAKRGGDWRQVTLDGAVSPLGDGRATSDVDLVALHDALERLATLDERQARIVELRFFGGLTNDEVAAVLDVSRRTVLSDWRVARAWLGSELALPD